MTTRVMLDMLNSSPDISLETRDENGTKERLSQGCEQQRGIEWPASADTQPSADTHTHAAHTVDTCVLI